MKYLLLTLFFIALFFPLLGQNYVQNHSFENLSISNPNLILFANGDVTDWSTSVIFGSGTTNNEVRDLIECFIAGGSQVTTASDQQYFAQLYPNTLIRNNLNDKIFPGQTLTVSLDHRGTFCSGDFKTSYVYLHKSGSNNINVFNNQLLTSFLSPTNSWATATTVTTLSASPNSPCFFDRADIRLGNGFFASEGSEEKSQLTDTDYNLYDDMSITGCEVATDDLLFYNIGTQENCAKVSFTLECDLEDKKWYYWEFGDGTTLCGPDEPSPMHTYLAPGTYTVHLTTVNGDGCLEKVSQEITILCNGCKGLIVDFDYECKNCLPLYEFLFDKLTGQWISILVGYNCSIEYTDNSFVTVFGESIVSWTWTRNGVVFSNSQNPTNSLSAPPIGGETYEICLSVVDSRGCVDQVCEDVTVPCRFQVVFDGLIEDPQTDQLLQQPTEVDLKVFPNPATDQINVNLTSDQQLGQWTLQLFDLNGRSLRTLQNTINYDQFNTTLNLADLPRGTYLLQLQTDQGVQHEKIVLH